MERRREEEEERGEEGRGGGREGRREGAPIRRQEGVRQMYKKGCFLHTPQPPLSTEVILV